MVLVKMLMEFDPLPMRVSMVMTMVMISPSRREVSPVEQLCRSPRLVLPCGSGVSSRELAYDFFLDERLHIAKDGHQRAARGAHEAGGSSRGVGRAPPSWTMGAPPPLVLHSPNIVYIF